MSGGVGSYAAVCARVRVKYSSLLGASEFRALSDAPDLNAFYETLKRTPYAAYIRDSREGAAQVAEVSQAFRRGLANEAASVIRATPGAGRRIVAQLHRRFEVNNLKALLRGIAATRSTSDSGGTWSRVQPLLFPLGDFSSLPLEAMAEAGGIPAAVELLRGSPYHEALASALARYSSEQSLFPLEVALDLAYWRALWQETQKLAGEDHRQSQRVIGALIDANNLMWAIRYKLYKHLSEEELINYTLSIGYRVTDADIRAVAAGAEIASIVGRLYPELQDVMTARDDPRENLPELETSLQRAMAARCMAAFLGNPFHVGLPLAYLVLHDLEVRDLTTLLEARASDAGTEEYQQYLTRAPLLA